MKRNFVLTSVSVSSRLLVSTLLFLLLARLWGPAQFGTFSYIFSICALLALIVDFGLPLYLLREISAEPAKAPVLVARSLKTKSLLALLMLTVGAVMPVAIGSRSLPLGLYVLLLLAALFLSYAEFAIAPLRALGRYDLETLLAAGGNLIQFLFAGGVASIGGSPTAVAGAIVVSRLLYLIASWIAMKRVVHPLSSSSISIRFCVTFRDMWPYGLDGAFTAVWGFIDIVAVRILFGAHVVGLYAAGQKFVQGVVALAPIVGNVMIPRLARKASLRSSDTWRTAARTGYLMAGIGLTFAVPLMVIPHWIVDVIFGSDFAELGDWLPWFGGIILIRFAGAGFGVVLSAIGLPKKRVKGQILALFVYMSAVFAIAMRGDGPEAALLAMLVAMATMGLFYAAQVVAVRRSNFLVLGSSPSKTNPMHQRRANGLKSREG